MRKIAIVLLAITFGFKGFAQDDVNESKSFRLGLHFDPYITWYSPVDKKKFENGGTKMKFSLGAVTDFKLGGNVWLSTGANFSFLGGAVNYLENPEDSIGYFFYDNEVVNFENIDTSLAQDFIMVTKRDFRVRYLTIPLLLKIKTKEIGYLTYFGQFGVINHLKMGSVKTDDEGTNIGSSNNPDLTDLIVDKEPSFFNVAANVGFGVEYNLSGTTSLFGSVGYNYGLNSAIKKESEHIVELDDNGNFQKYGDQKFNPHAVVISIGVLF